MQPSFPASYSKDELLGAVVQLQMRKGWLKGHRFGGQNSGPQLQLFILEVHTRPTRLKALTSCSRKQAQREAGTCPGLLALLSAKLRLKSRTPSDLRCQAGLLPLPGRHEMPGTRQACWILFPATGLLSFLGSFGLVPCVPETDHIPLGYGGPFTSSQGSRPGPEAEMPHYSTPSF